MAMSRIGRPSKGPRGHLVTRPLLELDALVRAAALERDMSVSDYVSWQLAEALKRPDLAPPPDKPSAQGQLPLEREGAPLKRSA
jgi:hypothetical protein